MTPEKIRKQGKKKLEKEGVLMSENIKEVNKQEEKSYWFHWVKQFSYLTLKSVETEVDVNEESIHIESTSRILGIGKGKKKSWNLKRIAVRSAETKKLINYIDLAFAAAFIIAGFTIGLWYIALAAIFIWTGINTSIVIETTLGDTIKIPASDKGEAEDFVKHILSNGINEISEAINISQEVYFVMIDGKSIKKTGKELAVMYKEGQISKESKIWKKGMKEWTEFGNSGLIGIDTSKVNVKSSKTKKYIKIAAVVVGVCIVLLVGSVLVQDAVTINMVQEGYIYSHPDVELGDMLEAFLADVEWERVVDDYGNDYVNVYGMGYLDNVYGQFAIQYYVYEDTFEFSDMMFENQRLSAYDHSYFIDAVYSNYVNK